jgi:hypothetical protein
MPILKVGGSRFLKQIEANRNTFVSSGTRGQIMYMSK